MPGPEISLIGCGRIGFILENDRLRNKPCTHYGGARSAGLRITSACDRDPTRLKKFGELADIPEQSLFSDYKTLFKYRNPVITIIATWTDSHELIALESIKNGSKIIILEKPVASSLAGVKKIINEAEKVSCRIIVNHERRFDSRYNKVREMLNAGLIGEIKSVNARILTGAYRGISRIEEGGGPLLHDGTHLVDIIRFFFGEIITVQGEFSRNERSSGFEDTAYAWMQSEKGINIFLEAGGSRKYFRFELEIWGTEGKIQIGNGCHRLYLRKKSSLYAGFNDLYEVKFPAIKQRNCFTELYRSTSSMLKGREATDVSGIRDGYKALEIIHAIYYSSHLGGKKISIPVRPGKINLRKIFNLT